MLRISLIILSFTLILGCEPPKTGTERLEGSWLSDKRKTLKHMPDDVLSDKQLDHLEDKLGNMIFNFKADEGAVSFANKPKETLNFRKYRILSEDRKSMTIVPAGSTEVTLHFTRKCFYFKTHWGYNEYFCKQK